MNTIKTCTHIKDDGSPCAAIPVHNSPYCYFHRKFYNPPALPGDKNYQPPLLESHHSIVLATTQLYQSFAARKIDMKEARFSFQILRLAATAIAAIEKAAKEEQKKQKLAATGRPGTSAVAANPAPAATLQTAAEPARKSPQPAVSAEPPRQSGIYDPEGCFSRYSGNR